MDAVDKAKRALSFHFLLKVLNLSMNIAVARVVSPALFGHANINLLLLNTLVLHFTRECFRRVALQAPNCAGKIMWLGTFSAWLFAPLAWYFWPESEPSVTGVICIAACVEAAAEPLYTEHLISMEMKYRALAEGLALSLRGCAILLTVSYGLMAFAIGQLAYATTVVAVYLVCASYSPMQYLQIAVDSEAQSLLKAGLVIAILKFVLSEGEKIVLMLFAVEHTQQGVYALVASIGSIVTRNLFQPIEETTYGLFSKLKGTSDSPQVAISLIKVMWVLGLGAVVYGHILSSLFIRVLYGAHWVEAGADIALRHYSIYIFLMALYGVVDAIGFAQSTREELHTREVAMVLFSLVYICVSVLLVGGGASGIIASNCLSYVCRLVFAVWVLRSQLPQLTWRDLLPDVWTACSFIGVFMLGLAGPYAAAVLIFHLPLLWKRNRQYIMKAKRD